MVVVVGEPLEDEHDEGKELNEEGEDEGGRDELVEVDGVQKVRNVTSGDARPEYDLCNGGDSVEEDDGKKMADAKDESEEGESKQNNVVEAQGRVENKEESVDDIADKDEKRKQEPEVVDYSPRDSFLLIIQVLLLLLLESEQGDGDGEDEDDQGQACSDGVEVQDEVGGGGGGNVGVGGGVGVGIGGGCGGGGQLWPKLKCEVSAGGQPGRRHILSSDNQGSRLSSLVWQPTINYAG